MEVMHKQTYMQRVMCRVLKSYKHEPIKTKQCNMELVLNPVTCNQIIILLLGLI